MHAWKKAAVAYGSIRNLSELSQGPDLKNSFLGILAKVTRTLS